jgi:hypothetical protein
MNDIYIISMNSILANAKDMSFITFVWRSLYPKGDDASKDEGL